MSKTFGNALTQQAIYLQTAVGSSGSWSGDAKKLALNNAYRFVIGSVSDRLLFTGTIAQIQPITVPGNQNNPVINKGALSNRPMRVAALSFNGTSATNKHIPVTPETSNIFDFLAARDTVYDDTDTLYQSLRYLEFGTLIYLHPTFSTNQIYHVWGIIEPDELTSSSQPLLTPDLLFDFVVMNSVIELLAAKEMLSKASAFTQLVQAKSAAFKEKWNEEPPVLAIQVPQNPQAGVTGG